MGRTATEYGEILPWCRPLAQAHSHIKEPVMSRWRLAWVARGALSPTPAQVADLGNVHPNAAPVELSLAIHQVEFIQLPEPRKR
jgi:hypothetical protein